MESKKPEQQCQQTVSNEQMIQVLNKLKTKGAGASIAIDEIVGEFQQLFVAVVNQKNNEITAKDKEITSLKEELAKKQVEDKYEKKLPESKS
jgi:hypothetical protein